MGYIYDYEDTYPSWSTEHNDFVRTACYPIKPSIKEEFAEIYMIYHFKVTENRVYCIHLMNDGSEQLHPSHKIGECPFCEYEPVNSDD